MDVAGLSDERDARSVVTHRSSGTRDRRGHQPRGYTGRSVPAHVRQAGSTPTAPTTNQAADAVDRATVVADTADQRQADYFLRLLTQNRRLIDQRIDGYHKAIAIAEAKGDAEGVSVFRRTARIEEHERNVLDAMIDNLHRRFPVPQATEAPQIPSGPWLVVR
jgi:hypothetical protein